MEDNEGRGAASVYATPAGQADAEQAQGRAPDRWLLVALPLTTILVTTVLGLAPFVHGVSGVLTSPRVTSGTEFSAPAGQRRVLLHRTGEDVSCELRGDSAPPLVTPGRPVSWRWGAERWTSSAEFEGPPSGRVTLLCRHPRQTFIVQDAGRGGAATEGRIAAGLLGGGSVLLGGIAVTVVLAHRRLRRPDDSVASTGSTASTG